MAVTACPAGIAHTFLAAESLELAAKEMNIALRVETQGSAGTLLSGLLPGFLKPGKKPVPVPEEI